MKRKEIAIFLTLLAFYIFYQRPPLYANRYLYLTYSIVDRATFDVDVGYEKFTDRSIYNNHRYIAANPGVSFIAVPVYAGVRLLHPLFRLFTDDMHTVNNFFINIIVNNIPVCLAAVLFFRLLGDFGLRGRKRIFLTLVLGLGTIIFCYSLEYFAKATLSMFFAFSAFYLLLHGLDRDEYRSPPPWRLVLSGACCGMCILNGYEHALFCLVFGFYLLTRLRISKLALLVLSAAVFLVPLFVYQKICFGGWLATYGEFMEMPYHVEALGRGYNAPSLTIMDELTLGLHRGFFSYMPVMVVSVIGALAFFAGKLKGKPGGEAGMSLPVHPVREVLFFIAVPAVYIVVLSGTYLWRGGCAFGPRYLVIAIPFFMLLSAFALRYREMKVPAMFLGGASLYVNWLGVQYDYGHYTTVPYYIEQFFTLGPRSAFTVWLAERIGPPGAMSMNAFIVLLNVILVAVLAVIVVFIWKRFGSEIEKSQVE